MNAPQEVPETKAEVIDLRHDVIQVVLKANGSSPKQSGSGLSWLKATVRIIDSGRDDLEQTHWKKVWRSMQGD